MLDIGTRIELHPAHDMWMRGDRYGTIIGYGRPREYYDTFTGEHSTAIPYRVQLDKTNKIIRVHPKNLTEV